MLRATVAPSSSHGIRTAWDLIVMPRSRSMSMRSRYWSRICRASTTPVICSIRSASVDLPWSMWAMMQKFRICSGGVADGVSAVRAIGDTRGYLGGRRDRPSSSHAGPRHRSPRSGEGFRRPA
jgi:hypothetical protein